jgi:hypothetical protein
MKLEMLGRAKLKNLESFKSSGDGQEYMGYGTEEF